MQYYALFLGILQAGSILIALFNCDFHASFDFSLGLLVFLPIYGRIFKVW